MILADNLPADLIWWVQVVQGLSCGFFYVKILFEDVKPGPFRSLGLAASPFFILLVFLVTLEFLFAGLNHPRAGNVGFLPEEGLHASVTLNLTHIGLMTLVHSSTFLSIALGLTLTYKVQRYGNFAQSEYLMIGMFSAWVISWTNQYSPLFDAPNDGVLAWTLFFRVVVGAFILTGIAGVIIDLLVYRGFRLRDATPQVMMIASLGVALALRALAYLRFSSTKFRYYFDQDFSRFGDQQWQIPTAKIRLIFGDRSLKPSEDANGNGVFDVETYTQQHVEQGLVPIGSQIGDIIPGTGEDMDSDGRFDSSPESYTHDACVQSSDSETGELLFDEATGEPILEKIVSEGSSLGSTGDSMPLIEIYDTDNRVRDYTGELMDCVPATINYEYWKGTVAATIFVSAMLLYLLLTKTRLGMRMRAVADNPDLAASSGINVERVQMTSAFLSAGVSGVGGAMFAMVILHNPATPFTLLLPAFAIIVLGTIGSIQGAIFASLIVGFVKALSSPILQGIGSPLGRSSFYTLEAISPYVFLIAILLVMPQGIGHAWEEWKIEKTRENANVDYRSRRKSRAILALLPTGIFGMHHWRNGRSDKAQNFSIAAIAAYFTHRASSFIGRESLSEGACGSVCSQPVELMSEELSALELIISPSSEQVARMAELSSAIDDYSVTNIELLTGRTDGTLLESDSPFFSETQSPLDESWLELMQTEIHTVNLIADAGDLIWPLVPLLLWVLAIIEGIRILRDEPTPGTTPSNPLREATAYLSKLATPPLAIGSYWTATKSRIRAIDRMHSEAVNKAKEWTTLSLRRMRELTPERNSPLVPEWLNDPHGRKGKTGSTIAFLFLLLILLGFLWWLPITGSDTWNWNKAFQVSNVVSTLCIFILMSFSLNLHTGYTGMVNFGVIFFVGIGAVMVGIMTAPEEMHGYGWDIGPALIVSMVVAGAIGWALAYPTARLRADYFAIVTISLGEILFKLLGAENLLRSGPIVSMQGISGFPKPLYGWWFCGSTKYGPGEEFTSADGVINSCKSAMVDSPSMTFSNLFNLGEPASYFTLLAILGLISVIVVWVMLDTLISSPWGRILKSIREDEEVAQHHGHDVLTHKAASLALGASIAALAGALWLWKLGGIEANFMQPAKSTFLVWAAFVIGGTANNRGMVIGAFIIVLMEFVFNVLVAASTPDLPLYTTAERIDSLFIWAITEQWEVANIFLIVLIAGLLVRSRAIMETGGCGFILFAFTGLVLGERSLLRVLNPAGEFSIAGGGMAHVKLLLVGLLMIFSLKYNPRGLLPEVPSRPSRPSGGESQ